MQWMMTDYLIKKSEEQIDTIPDGGKGVMEGFMVGHEASISIIAHLFCSTRGL